MKEIERPERAVFILRKNPDRSYSCSECRGCEDLCASLNKGLKCGISVRQEELGRSPFPFPILKTTDEYSSAAFTRDWKKGDDLIALLEIDKEKYRTDTGEYPINKTEEIYETLKSGSLEAIEMCCLTYDTA